MLRINTFYNSLKVFTLVSALATSISLAPAYATQHKQSNQVCANSISAEETSPSACCITEVNYSISAKPYRIPFNGVPTERSGPGGTIQVTRSHSGTVSASVTAGVQTEIDAVLAQAQVSVSATLTGSQTITTSASFTHDITPGKYGNAQYVSWGQEVSYTKFQVNHDCSVSNLASGTIIYPDSSKVGWHYWED